MLRQANNVFSVVLSDVAAVTSNLPSVGDPVTSQNMPVGGVVLVDSGMYRQTSVAGLATGTTYFIVQGKGAGQPLMKSPAIVKGTESITSKEFIPAVQQISTIGYNGTTGSLVAANNTSYYVKVRKNDNDAANRSQPFSLFAQFKTGGTATQEKLAFGLVKNGIRNMQLEPANGYLRYTAICDDAGAAITGTTTTFGVTYGNKEVILNGTVTNIAVGDLVRLGGTTTGTAVYKVAAVNSGTSITLEIAYQGITESIAVANVEVITTANAAVANFGIVLTGVQADFDVNAFRDYYVNRFTASFSDTNILITHLQGATEGNGSWQRVAMDEYMNYGFEGQNEMAAIPPKPRDQEVKIPGKGGVTALTAKYSIVNIKWTEDITGLVSKSGAAGNVLIYLNLEDNAGSGELPTTPVNTGETLATALGITPLSTLNE